MQGSISVLGKLTERKAEVESELQRLRLENQEFRDRIAQLEDQVNQLWNAPGIPGAEIARLDFAEHQREREEQI